MRICCHDRAKTEDDDGNVGPDVDENYVHTEKPIRVVLRLQVGGGVQIANPDPKRSPHYKLLQRYLVLLQTEHTQDRQFTYTRNKEARSRNNCCREKAVNIKYSEYVSVLLPHFVRHIKRMGSIISSCVAYHMTASTHP